MFNSSESRGYGSTTLAPCAHLILQSPNQSNSLYSLNDFDALFCSYILHSNFMARFPMGKIPLLTVDPRNLPRTTFLVVIVYATNIDFWRALYILLIEDSNVIFFGCKKPNKNPAAMLKNDTLFFQSIILLR